MGGRGLFLLFLLIGVARSQYVTSVYPYRLGEGGGVTLNIYGRGFSEDQFSQFDPTIGNIVFLVNEVDSIECDVINYLTTTTKIVCNTRALVNKAGPRVYAVQVFSDGIEAMSTKTVEYTTWTAPKISYIQPSWSLPNKLLRMTGWFHTDKHQFMDVSNPTETGPTSIMISKVYVGGVNCEMINATTGELYEAPARNSILCLAKNRYIGPMNGTVYVTNRGSSVNVINGVFVDSQDRLYQHHTYAAIYEVTPRSGSTGGQTLITVNGVGFDPYPGRTEVTVGGAVCEIQSITDFNITCLTPRENETQPSPGERGLLWEIWGGKDISDLRNEDMWNNVTSSTPSHSEVLSSLDFQIGPMNGSTGRLSGYIHAPHNGTYSLGFYVPGGSSIEFYIAENGMPKNKTRSANWGHFNLAQGIPAYIELRYKGMGNGNVKVAMNDYNAKWNNKQTGQGIDEVHRVSFRFSVTRETQRVTIPSGSGHIAKFFVNGFPSNDLDVTNTSLAREALLSLMEQQCDWPASGPLYFQWSEFEHGDPLPIGLTGTPEDSLPPFCGRKSMKLQGSRFLYYERNENNMINLKTAPFVCFAILGRFQDTMKIGFRWIDDRKRPRNNHLSFAHYIPTSGYQENQSNRVTRSTPELRWYHQCINMTRVMEDSFINARYDGGMMKVYLVSAPRPVTDHNDVYVDSFTFSSEDIRVTQARPSALNTAGILIEDINVDPVTNPEGNSDIIYNVTFITANCQGRFPLLRIIQGIPSESTMEEMILSPHRTSVTEESGIIINRTQVASLPVEGNWSVTIQGVTVKGLSPRVSSKELEDILRGALGHEGIEVQKTGGCSFPNWQIKWTDDPGRKDVVVVNGSRLIFDGEQPSISAHRVREGKIYHNPAVVDFFSVRRERPHVAVSVNGYHSACLGNSSFTYNDANRPIIEHLEADRAGSSSNYFFTVIGKDFSSYDYRDISVALGNTSCIVTSITFSRISCALVYMPAGTYQLSVSMQPVGAALQPEPLFFFSPLILDSIVPATGGTGGGYKVVISGRGLAKDIPGWLVGTLTIGGLPCEITAAEENSVTCVVPPRDAGEAEVTASIAGITATLQSRFLYDASLTPQITSLKPSVVSVLGGEVLTISGSGFGSGENSFVMVGQFNCTLISWSTNEVKCLLPSHLPPDEYHVLLSLDGQDSTSWIGKVTYILKVTGTSLNKGSVKGGTVIVLRGEGFTQNCSLLEVTIGASIACKVIACSNDTIRCITVVSEHHLITNDGVHPSYGPGFAWNPARVILYEDDIITWRWQKKNSFSQVVYNVFETPSATIKTHANSGFISGSPTSSGNFTFKFQNAGTYYFASDPVGDGIILSGEVEVRKRLEEVQMIRVTLAGIEATHESHGQEVEVNLEGCGSVPVLQTPLSGCQTSPPLPPSNLYFYFSIDLCWTPQVTAISASPVYDEVDFLDSFFYDPPQISLSGDMTLRINGSGFGTEACRINVTIGQASCRIISATDTEVTCMLDAHEKLMSLAYVPLSLNVANRGFASFASSIAGEENRIVVVPTVTSYSPKEGSLAGGTLLVITGFGLLPFDGYAVVFIGSEQCDIQRINSTTITCLTSPSEPGSRTINVQLTMNGIEPMNRLSDFSFTFSTAATPSVRQVTITGRTATISGSSFGNDPSKVNITLSEKGIREKRSIKEETFPYDTLPVPPVVTADTDEEIGIFDEEAEEPRSPHRPKINKNLFDRLDGESHFWGMFTGTSAKSFSQSKDMGAWRVGGTQQREVKEDPLLQIFRSKREIEQELYNCLPNTVTDTSITCGVEGLPAGDYDISVIVDGVGSAQLDGFAVVTVVISITSMVPSRGSIHGGTLLIMNGAGFVPGSTEVAIDGNTCVIEQEEINIISCRTPPHDEGTFSVSISVTGNGIEGPSFTYSMDETPTIFSILPDDQYINPGQPILLNVSGSLSAEQPQVTVGGVDCDVLEFNTDTVVCNVPGLPGGAHNIVLRDPEFGDSNSVEVTFELAIASINPSIGGFGGIDIEVTGLGFSSQPESSSVSICDSICAPIASSVFTLACAVPPREPGDQTALECDVTVTNPDGQATTKEMGFKYDTAVTSIVLGISPRRGGTAGGTTITITGSDFATSGNNVSIGGSDCIVASESSTAITCVTESHQGPGTFRVLVTVPDSGFAMTDENSEFFYIDRWSSVFTWDGNPIPSTGQFVVIEEGQTVLLDESTDVLKMLLIKGGHLVFDQEATEEIVLKAEYILIVEDGSLSIGSEDEPYLGQAAIELYGNTHSIELPVYGSKVVAVRNGTLDIHGAPLPVTWTHLASTASPGDTQITLKQPVTWKAGDRIVIATTEKRFEINENEERTIDSVLSDGLTLVLTEPLEFEHISIEQNLGGRTIETRAEVGLLTRNVKIQGAINEGFVEGIKACDDTWNPGQFATQSCFNGRFGEETGTDQFGAQVMIAGKYKNMDAVRGRIEYAEVTEAGQAFQLGRYPLHFHLVGSVNTSYIRGCSIHRTYNRAITIHAADSLLIEKNVVYNNMGHAIFTEDGIEQNNVIQYNLAVYTRTSSSLLNVDVTPASYWVVNPNNIIRHNAASGGTHFGYWYRLQRNPSGPSTTSSYCPNTAPMGQFFNNTAHSMGRYGLWIFSMAGYFPRTRACSGSQTVAEWHDFTVWHCERGAEAVIGGALQFHNFVALDNELAGLEMVEVFGNFGKEDGPGIFNSLVVGHSELTPEGCIAEMSGIVAPKKTIFNIDNTTFVNFDSGMCAALSGCSQCKPFQGGYRSQVNDSTFINSPNKLRFKWQHETIWIDADGSLSGTAENSIVPSMDTLPPSLCNMNVQEFSVNPVVPGAVCSDPMKFLRVTIMGRSVVPDSLKANNLVMSNDHGSVDVPYRFKRLSGEGWMAILHTNDTYTWEFDHSSSITNISYDATTYFVEPDDSYIVKHQFFQKPDGLGTLGEDRNASDSPLDLELSAHGDYYLPDDNRTVTYIVSGKSARKKRSTAFEERDLGANKNINLRVYRCKYDGCIPPTIPSIPAGRPETTLYWSNVSTWKEVHIAIDGQETQNTYSLPQKGDEVVIPQGFWIIVDTEVPPLGRVYVYGALEFDDTMDHTFEATIIYIQGGKVVAGFSEDDPFTHDLTISLRGSLDRFNLDNGDMPMPYGTPNVGWKAIGIFGSLSLHGLDPGKTWVKLGSTAAAGVSELTLAEPVDEQSWLNKQVMITTTGKEASETEICGVTSVSGTTLGLDCSLQYEHLGALHSLPDGVSYSLAAEVGLLSRNIKIIGVGTDDSESFGGRILVSQVTHDGLDYRGEAQLSNVQLQNMGQEGFTNMYDPRYSIVFYGLGDEQVGLNYLKKCSFHKNYNTAIGFFGSNNISIEDNVIYHTVGSSIRDDSMGNKYYNNLISVMLFPGTYKERWETQNLDWFGGFSLNKASQTILEGNVVAGSEQAGYQTYGEDCGEETRWMKNEAHNVIYGIMMWAKAKPVSSTVCRRVNSFYVWRAFDTAFYMQHYTNLLLDNVMSVDSQVGVNQLIYAPPALSHGFFDKTATTQNSIFVGASPSHTCDYQTTGSDILRFYSPILWAGGVEGGHSGILFGTFASSVNMAPKHAFHEQASYPALWGATYISSVTFGHFKTRSCGKDVAISTNSDADDGIHPIFVMDLTFFETPTDNYVFMHAPKLSRVNPSDCVDMSCDGHKKVVIQDKDGTLLGSVNATATSQAEYQWDGDRSHGVGDYRIPVPLRQNTDGTKINSETKFPNKGIVRNGNCNLISSWRAWKCTDLHHRMMVIESMDSDTEIRRLSPIALIANPGTEGYVDLLNGPMDRGWCMGYTCQERISTFYSIVAPTYIYEMAMTSTPPQILRFHLLHSDSSEAVVLRIFYPKTQRYDVYVDDLFVPPTNIDKTQYPDSYQLIPYDPSDPEAFFPTLSDPVGANYLQRNEKFFHVVIRGGHVIDIKMMPVVILNMGIVVNTDDFFEENVVNNMAMLLDIPPENIRITSIIREDAGKRRKRSITEVVDFEFEIGSAPADSSSPNNTGSEDGTEAQNLEYDDLLNSVSNVITAFQTNTCNNCSFSIASLGVIEPVAPPVEPGPRATEEMGTVVLPDAELYSNIQQQQEEEKLEESLNPEVIEQPNSSYLEEGVPPEVIAFTPFSNSVVYIVESTEGNVIKSLGHSSDPWQVTASLSGGPDGGQVLGTTTVPYINGSAVFSNLVVNKAGHGYKLTFRISYPTAALELRSDSKIFRADERRVTWRLTSSPDTVTAHEEFKLSMSLVVGEKPPYTNIEPEYLMGQSMAGHIQLLPSGDVQGHLIGHTRFEVNDGEVANVTLKDVSITDFGIYRYVIMATVSPAGWKLSTHGTVNVIPTTPGSVVVEMKAGSRSRRLRGNEKEFGKLVVQELKREVGTGVYWNHVRVDNIDMVPYVEVTITGSPSQLDDALWKLCYAIRNYQIRVQFFCRRFVMTDMVLLINDEISECPTDYEIHHAINNALAY